MTPNEREGHCLSEVRPRRPTQISLIEIPRKSRPKISDPVIIRFCSPQTRIKSLSMTSSSECSGLTVENNNGFQGAEFKKDREAESPNEPKSRSARKPERLAYT